MQGNRIQSWNLKSRCSVKPEICIQPVTPVWETYTHSYLGEGSISHLGHCTFNTCILYCRRSSVQIPTVWDGTSSWRWLIARCSLGTLSESQIYYKRGSFLSWTGDWGITFSNTQEPSYTNSHKHCGTLCSSPFTHQLSAELTAWVWIQQSCAQV